MKKKQKASTKLRLGDEVIVIAGKEKGKRGKILYINAERAKVVVQSVNLVSRFQRPTQESPQGSKLEIEVPMHISNVAYYSSKSKKGRRLAYVWEDSKKYRAIREFGEEGATRVTIKAKSSSKKEPAQQ